MSVTYEVTLPPRHTIYQGDETRLEIDIQKHLDVWGIVLENRRRVQGKLRLTLSGPIPEDNLEHLGLTVVP